MFQYRLGICEIYYPATYALFSFLSPRCASYCFKASPFGWNVQVKSIMIGNPMPGSKKWASEPVIKTKRSFRLFLFLSVCLGIQVKEYTQLYHGRSNARRPPRKPKLLLYNIKWIMTIVLIWWTHAAICITDDITDIRCHVRLTTKKRHVPPEEKSNNLRRTIC